LCQNTADNLYKQATNATIIRDAAKEMNNMATWLGDGNETKATPTAGTSLVAPPLHTCTTKSIVENIISIPINSNYDNL
jgi:hypothetical protein